jgi:hypothetical protein
VLQETATRIVSKRLCLHVRSEGLRAVLEGLLKAWHYHLLAEPAGEDLVLAEEGCLPPAPEGQTIWLTSSRYEARNRLPLPFALEELWSALENRFHKPPRNHLRMATHLPVMATVRDETVATCIVSLSDLGARFLFPCELVNGEELTLEGVLDDKPRRLEGRVIYVVPRGDLDDTGRSEIGVIFDRTPPETRTAVREFIIRRYLEQVRAALPEATFCDGLSFLRISENVLRALGRASQEQPL